MLSPAEVVDEFSQFLTERAGILYTKPPAFAPIPKKDWLMEEIGVLLDKDDWHKADVAKLASLFFFLLVGPE